MNLRMCEGIIVRLLAVANKGAAMSNLKRFGIKFFPKNQAVEKILEQVPKGARSLFIEQAILNFASKSPSISFHFEGITKPKRIRRSKNEIVASENLKNVNGEAQPHQHKPQTSEKTEVDGNKMYFNFNKMGAKQ